jgi:hypothetical protein
MIGKPPQLKSYDLLSYQIRPFPFPDEGGEAALRSVFNNKTPFAHTAAVAEIPRKGVYCFVDVEWTPPGITAAIFKYVSLLTLTALPSWSVRESYTVRYYLFINGKRGITLEYKIARKTALWLGLLPVIWVNLSNHSQAEAFEATALQFFEDAKPIFSTLDPHEMIIY